MTATPEYPVISTADLKVGQQYRHGPWGLWYTFNGRRLSGDPQWVEAKPAPFQPGDRVRWDSSDTIGTVKAVGTDWLIVQVDGRRHEDVWATHYVEHIGDDDQ